MKFDFPHSYLKETDSTNAEALRILSKTKPADGFMVFADYQTAGRGQYGRNWHSEAGKNLLFSLIFENLNFKAEELFRIHVATSLSILSILKNEGLESLAVKWPNDIYCQGKKLGGLLVQNQFKGKQCESSIIGIGLNVNQQQFPSDLNACSLSLLTGKTYEREPLAISIRAELQELFKTKSRKLWDQRMEVYKTLLIKI
jgi:BirA family biotin operon repressor/biotin-[acetyl-CoA-carboxylase] ligase